MSTFTLTIAREFYAMGRSVAKCLSRKTDIPFYDRDIVEEVAAQLNQPLSTISDIEEKSRNGFFQGLPFPFGTDEDYMEKLIYDAQKTVIEDVAAAGDCILVGRCSDQILAEKKNSFHIFLYAPYEYRVQRCMDALHLDEAKARKTVTAADKKRSAYHRKFAGYSSGDYKHKQLLIDSSILGVDGTADLIAGIIKKKFRPDLAIRPGCE